MAQNQFSMDLNLKAYPNQLTPDVDDDYTVKVDTQSTPLNLDDIARATAQRLGEEEVKVKAALQVGMEVIAQAVASGFCVSTPLCYAQPMATGVVMEHELSQPVDRDKVRVYASFRQGTAVTEALAQTKLQLFLQPAATGPYIAGMTSAFYSEQTGTGGAVTRVPLPMEAGGMAVITGNGLKVVGTDPTVGAPVRAARGRHRRRLDGESHHPILRQPEPDQRTPLLYPAPPHLRGHRSRRTRRTGWQ